MPGNSSSRQFSSASANKAASASSSPAMVFKNAGGLKARSMNSLQMQLREQAAAGRESREHRREQGATVVRGSWERLREQGAAAGRGGSREHGFVQPNIHVFYNEGSELSEFRSDIFFLKHASSIFRQLSNPVCGSQKGQASSPWAKQHRA